MYYDTSKIDRDACGIGMIVNIDGKGSHRTLSDALTIVEKLEHRAGKDASGKVGDGVGILLQISHAFYKKAAEAEGIRLGEAGSYGIAMCFLPTDKIRRTFAMRMFEVIMEKEGLSLLGWRKVPIHPEILGERARECMPEIYQCFVGCKKEPLDGDAFERRLFVARREFEQSSEDTYICSFSSRTVVYKGMFLVSQLREFYDDLQDEAYETAVALVHSRFSTNTTPSWNRAHPYRMIAHNGEINTIRGNADRMLAREETMHAHFADEDVDKILPVIADAGSDSAMLDNTLEFMYMNGMPLPLAMMVLIPEPWKNNGFMEQPRKDFYHYYATMMEPWDGPAAVLFTDGKVAGATLDRNGLRPSRYYVTDDNRLILSSEVGVLDIDPAHIVKKSRLFPGRMLLIDLEKKKLVSDEECKSYYSTQNPYGEWVDGKLKRLMDVPVPNEKLPVIAGEDLSRLYKVFGYTYEDVQGQILSMARNGVEPTASMGKDSPLAFLSHAHPLLFDYFHQQFAQVTNPPIDSLREKIVTDTTVYLGSDGDLLEEKADNCRMLEIDHPILDALDVARIKSLNGNGFVTQTVSLLYYKNTSLTKAITQLCVAVDRAAAKGANIILLSDRGVDANHVPIPSLLAVSSIEQHLVATRKRTYVSLILESGEIRDVHQCACVMGFGVRAVFPYVAHAAIAELIADGRLDKDMTTAIGDYNLALLNGVVKIAAKMGISTLQSYQSARIFEAVGLSEDFVNAYFTGITCHVGGIGAKEIAEDVSARHDKAFDPLGLGVDATLDSTGFHSLRSGKNAEDHLYSPKTIVTLQRAVREGDYERFKEYTKMVDDDTRPHTIRSLFTLVPQKAPIPIDSVESVEEIVKRFQTGAMSYGSLSEEAHETLAIAMNRLGAKSNTGEGGENAGRFGTEKNSAVKQVASGRFGVTSAYLCSAKEIQIKMAQGAKPGEGGHLPGKKVYPWVASVRYSTPGVSLISPPPHHDIYSIEDLAQLIYDLKNANRDARISVKLVSESGVGTIASGVAKAGADVILVSGFDGGTGAAPMSSIHHAGLPWELGLAEAHKSLLENGLRDKVILETDGKLMSGWDIAVAALLGAEEFGFATAPLVAMGCMMMRVCSKDTCPAGIATQNKCLRARFKGKPEHVENFMRFMAMQLREIMAELGFASVDEMVGQYRCLQRRKEGNGSRTDRIDTAQLFAEQDVSLHREAAAKNPFIDLSKAKDVTELLPAFEDVLSKRTNRHEGVVKVEVSSTDRTFGSILGSEVTKTYQNTLPDDALCIEASGGGGQSFGAFLPKGVTIRLYGDTNDGFGKGLSGGRLVVMPPKEARFAAHENTIAGNVALFGATDGTAYICGMAGERFAVRNSGVVCVCEGCGDHGLEYMTGGRAVILGMTGKNFAAGMSGGIAYVYDPTHTLYLRANKDMVDLDELKEKYDIEELKAILSDYVKETDSAFAKTILSNFADETKNFKKVIPHDYRRMMSLVGKYEEQGIPHDTAVLEAFREASNG
ncbi:MAG: glutamate synthase large subunit [Lachnospiraceae bacterium]|nr:glutamate synthase large subunit [Lachnospiraceae bacterium]